MSQAPSHSGEGSDHSRGALVVVAAPSGAGKTSLVKAVVEREPRIRFSTSYTTRPPRPAEVDGRDYFFVSPDTFRQMVADGAFLEHARVFDNWYGTSREQVESLLADGYFVILEIDWQGARQIRDALPECRSAFILPPSAGELERRLRGRATDSADVIQRRLDDALADMSHWDEFDFVVINDDFATAVDELLAVVRGEGARLAAGDPARRERIAGIVAPQTAQ